MTSSMHAIAVVFLGLVTGAPLSSYSHPPDTAGVLAAEHALASALLTNDADGVSRLLREDWTVVDTHGGVADRAGFLGVIKSGQFSRKTLDLDDTHVVLTGDIAVVTTRVRTSGMIMGKAFNVMERETDVWVWRDGRWSALATSEVEIRA